jgi:hypothetical protein
MDNITEFNLKITSNYSTLINKLVSKFNNARIESGRKFDRIVIDHPSKRTANGAHDDKTLLFVDRATWKIYGAKSTFQFNPRRFHGTLLTIDEYDWTLSVPHPHQGTPSALAWATRELHITSTYKPRGRPRKNPTPS